MAFSPSRRHKTISQSDSRIAVAEISTRLDSLDDDYQDLRGAFTGLGKRIDDLGSSINAKIDQRSQPQWQTYIGAAMLLGGLFFAFISPLQKNEDVLAQSIRDLGNVHRDFVKSVNDEFTRRNDFFVSNRTHNDLVDRITKTDKRNETADTELKELIARVSARLTIDESRFLSIGQFQEFKDGLVIGLSDLRARILLIEQTRPTTGELSAIAKSADQLASKLEDRIKAIETFERERDSHRTKEQ